MKKTMIGLLLLSALGGAALAQDTLEIVAEKDNSLYQNEDGELSNGAGAWLFVGRTNQPSGYLRRGLVQFSLSELPSDAEITDVELRFRVDRNGPGSIGAEISVHPVTSSWGEGPSDAGAPGGRGASAAEGDATWLHTRYPDDRWNSAGGDYQPEAVATQTFDGPGALSFQSDELTSLVQGWLEDPPSNNGLIIIGNEERSRSAIRLLSREASAQDGRPQLIVSYE